MSPNPGHCPPEAAGKSVRVRLVGDPDGKNIRTWPADPPTRWDAQGTPGDIAEYEVVA